jgi:hypothetical protein
MKKFCMLFVAGFVLVACAFAQAQEPVGPGQGMMFFQKAPVEANSAVGLSNYFYTMTVGEKDSVKGAPYSATAITESTQVLVDGNRIVNKTSTFLARDGEGRTRREMSMNINSLTLPNLVMISDPVAKTETMLNALDQSARVTKGGPGKRVFVERFNAGTDEKAGAEGSALERVQKQLDTDHNVLIEGNKVVTGDSTDNAAKSKQKVEAFALAAQAKKVMGETRHEDLGTQVIEGISCTGTRETRTIPAGAIGNERPLEITSETWKSTDLHVIVLSKHNDPRFGETVYKLTDIKRDEPDATLFEIPSNYKVIEGHELLKP